uniref:Secreted protein n=1 Tax=Panagrolaimus sp. JU765 TaxID=591449 RepID=A0AC34RMS5_9BILA
MLLWILFSSIYFVASTTHECNVAQLEFCYFQYFERFALPWFPDYPTFLNRTIEIRRFEGWPGQEKICM